MGVPERALRPLVLQTPEYEQDDYNAQVVTGYEESDITGKIDQKSRRENTLDGRQASIGEWLLITNSPDCQSDCRIKDGTAIYELVGPPWPVYRGPVVHHYEADLVRVEG